jgi:hypothetical protein
VKLHAGRRTGAGQRRLGIEVVWPALAILVAAQAANQAFGLGGEGASDFFDDWLPNALLWSAAALCLAGALREPRSRVPWVLVAVGLASWAIGDTLWSIRFGDATDAPVTSVSDVFWLAWYPLAIAALVLLVRDRVPGFELHRWIDGVVLMLIVATPWVGLFLQPVAEESSARTMAEVIDFAYPLGDFILVGGVLGVIALMGWRPGRMWLVLGLGLAAMGLADAVYSVQALEEAFETGVYDVGWSAGAVLVAYASWQPHPGRLEPREVVGWPAIALPLAAQALAASVQVYAYFHEVPRSERILTVIVLVIAMVQIVIARPRPSPRSAERAGGGP